MGQASHPTPPYVSNDGSVQPHPIELSQRRMLSLVHQKSSELACPFFFLSGLLLNMEVLWVSPALPV